MTTIDAVSAADTSPAASDDLYDDHLACPRCDAPARVQRVLRVVPDGALELTVFECSVCGQDHPAWA